MDSDPVNSRAAWKRSVLSVSFDDGRHVPAVIMLGLAMLLGFYFWHYFFLENTVRRWYRIAEEMRQQCADKGKSEIKKYTQKKTVSYRMIGYMRQPLQGNSILMKQMPDVLRIMVPLTVKNDHAHRLHGQLPQ